MIPNVHRWLSHHRLVRVWQFTVNQDAISYQPRRQCSLYCLNLQLNNGGGSNHTRLLDCLKLDHTCHDRHRFTALATNTENWNGKPTLACISVSHHLRKHLLVFTMLRMPKTSKIVMTEQVH